MAVFDTRKLQGGITVQFAKGEERFTPLFQKEAEHPKAGEVIFADETDLVSARRWCWRQSDQSASRPDTSNAILVVESQHEDSLDDIQAALQDLLELVGEYSGGELVSGILGADTPEISD